MTATATLSRGLQLPDQWIIDSNVQTHGARWTANWLRARGVDFVTAYILIFQRIPRVL